MSNTGATEVFTIRRPQFQVLQKIDLTIQLDMLTIGKHSIRGIRKSKLSSKRTIYVQTLLSTIRFEVLSIAILFLLYIADIDKLDVIFNNINNIFI